MAWHDGLTERQRKFCEAYSANGGNALAAAKEAGYKNPSVQGHQNLEKNSITAAIEYLRQETTSKAIATREERQGFWSSVMRSDEQTMKDRLKASELLGKCQADFTDNHRVLVQDTAPVQINFVGYEDDA